MIAVSICSSFYPANKLKPKHIEKSMNKYPNQNSEISN
jgi:hypothetical protein